MKCLFNFQHCGKAFSEGYKLRRHLREVHDNLKEHVCSTCGKTFARADKLFQHELVHVSKSDQPVEWVPIIGDSSVMPSQAEQKPSSLPPSSDESSDSSDSEEDEQLIKDIDEFLCTEIKEESQGEFKIFLEKIVK